MKEEKNKKKFNKKKLLTFGILGIFALALVNAGLMLYYGQVIASIEVTQPITVMGNLEYTIENAMAGDVVTLEGNVVVLNNADHPITIFISNDSPDGINVVYEYIVCGDMPCVIAEYLYQGLVGDSITLPAEGNGLSGRVYLRIYYELDSMLETGTYTITTTID